MDAALDTSVLEKGMNDFLEFAVKTYTGVVEERERKYHLKKSDLRMFGRLDISVLEREDGKREFFVNEIEMNHTMSLFLRNVGSLASTVAESFASVLWDKAVAKRKGYLV